MKKIFVSLLIFATIAGVCTFSLKFEQERAEARNFELKNFYNLSDAVSSLDFSLFTESIGGEAQEPMSFIVVANSDDALVGLFRKANWIVADRPTPQNMLRVAKAVVKNSAYESAPMTPSFWNAKAHDFGFQKPTEKNSARQRHHIRFWKAPFKLNNGLVYFGTASLDVGISKLLVAHKIDPDIDTEREFILKELIASGAVLTDTIQLVSSYKGKNFGGDEFFTDGRAYLLKVLN